MKGLTIAFWRKWHRWIGFGAALFLLWAAGTGFLVAFTEFFGEEEALRERTRDLVSTVTLVSPNAAWLDADQGIRYGVEHGRSRTGG